jgi:hypothetical protein
MEAYIQRLIDERNELVGKIGRLVKFIGDPIYTRLSDEDRSLLKAQLPIMEAYAEILRRRIEIGSCQ